MSNKSILEIKNITKEFPGVRALSDVSFQVKKGEIHGLCGENGAGKSTLMKIISGVYPYDAYEGQIFFDGEEIQFKTSSIQQAIKKGIAIVHQELALVRQMTVGENIYLGREPVKNGTINWHRLYSDADKILNEYQLNIKSTDRISTLGVGKQQMVEIAKALSENVKLLILDEPTSALTDKEIHVLMNILKQLKKNGVTCIYISHKLEEVMEITDSITVIRDGAVIDTVPTSETNTDHLISMMVGREMKERFPVCKRTIGEKVFEVSNISVYDNINTEKKIVDRVSFSVQKGEILGIAGLMGAGRTELVTGIFGEYGSNVTGDIIMENKKIKINSAHDAITNHISLVPEDRKELGLVLIQSILKNISLANMDQFSSFLRINKHKENMECEKVAGNLSIKCASLDSTVNSLSGGNQQKVVIAKWLLSQPKVLILDEPTRGVDVGAKYEIYKLMNELAETGVAIIMVSSELPEILGMCDRILVMHEGKGRGILLRSEATQEKIMSLATGMEDSINNKIKKKILIEV